jgi:hypothetical protein
MEKQRVKKALADIGGWRRQGPARLIASAGSTVSHDGSAARLGC